MKLKDLPEGRRFRVAGSDRTGRLIRLGPGSAFVRFDASTIGRVGSDFTYQEPAQTTHIAVETVVEPLGE